MRIQIKKIIGPRCITKEDGHRIYEKIHDHLKEGWAITLDFQGVSQFASPFFNYAIGQLINDINLEDLKRNLQIENLDSTGEMVINRVIENASKYHSNVNYRKIVDSILELQSQESD